MKKIVEFLLLVFLKISLWFRYRIKVKGLEKLNSNTLNKPGGILFIPNHPTVFVDATSITIALWPKFPLRPLIVEYMYYLPIVNWIMRLLNALPIPNFTGTSNSLKKKKAEKGIQEVIKGLENKENFLIFPAGRTKSSAKECIDGASAVHKIVQEAKEANIVLVRVKGLWGSSFSRAVTGQAAPLFKTIFAGVKHVLKNLLFFTPRREVTIEFEIPPKDFPYDKNRLEFNRYLENWYNQPDGIIPSQDPLPGDSLVQVSYSMWKEEYLDYYKPTTSTCSIDLKKVPQNIQQKVIAKIAELTEKNSTEINPNLVLTKDLGMDSLDVAEVIAFLQDEFEVSHASPEDIQTVGEVMGMASKQIVSEEIAEEEEADLSKWNKKRDHFKVYLENGSTMVEAFLNNCDKMGNAVACGDMRAGVVTYSQLKLRTIILAEYIKTLPGKYVGILLPASVTATMTIFACQLAGKIPLMINWTVGSRHLKAVVELSKVEAVLSSWAFLDKLQNVDLDGLEDLLIMLEDVKVQIGLSKKIKGFFLSKLQTNSILKAFSTQNLSENDPAVLLFTSGTEGMPKGVPLSHKNILTNQKEALNVIEAYSDDVLYGFLPPFHSFGFTISTLGLLSGVKVAFSPDPTDGKRLANGFKKWGVTILCGAPTFIKGLCKNATPEQLKTLRLCFAGAEKLPKDLEQMMKDLQKEECLLEGYGITECSPILTVTPPHQKRVGVGKALPNVSLLIVDLNTHLPLPRGEQGLILAKGPNVFTGYINPGLSSPFITVDNQEWYNTGDLGYLDENNNLILSGRLKRFVKIGGEMISLASIEEALLHTALQEKWAHLEEGPILAISAKELPGEKPNLTLFTKFATSLDAVNSALKNSGFSNLVKISSVKQIPEIPIMGTGKVHYRKLDEINT